MIHIYKHATHPNGTSNYIFNGPEKDKYKAYILETEDDALMFVSRTKMTDEIAEIILMWAAAYKGIPIMVFTTDDRWVLSLMREYDHIPRTITLPKRFRKRYPYL